MLFDTHMHTLISTDSRMSITDAISRGQELGIGITITEHYELGYPKQNDYIFDIDDFFAQYGRYRGPRVLLGIEVGMRRDLARQTSEKLQDKPFDLVLGSIHMVEGIDIYSAEFYRGRTKREVYNRYFETMITCLELHDYVDSLSHFDFIARYAKFSDPQIYYSEFSDYLDALLSIIAERHKAIEINTKRLGNKAVVQALIPIYRRFAELGGRIVTIGSDAHKPADIGKYFPEAMEVAAASGLSPVWFEQREPHYIE